VGATLTKRTHSKASVERSRWACLGALVAVLSTPVSAVDYLSVATASTLYDAPSAKAKALYVIARDTPVEQVVVVGAWVKIRDSVGDLLWIEKQQLSAKRTVIVRVDRAKVRQEADEQAALSFEAERDVVLELADLASPVPLGWVKVKHRSGQIGYTKTKEVWGF
jgi:SH3-like domain-containing protein